LSKWGLLQSIVDIGQVQVARATLGQRETAQQHQWDADQKAKVVILGSDESLQHDLRRQIGTVCKGTSRDGEDREQGDRP